MSAERRALGYFGKHLTEEEDGLLGRMVLQHEAAKRAFGSAVRTEAAGDTKEIDLQSREGRAGFVADQVRAIAARRELLVQAAVFESRETRVRKVPLRRSPERKGRKRTAPIAARRTKTAPPGLG